MSNRRCSFPRIVVPEQRCIHAEDWLVAGKLFEHVDQTRVPFRLELHVGVDLHRIGFAAPQRLGDVAGPGSPTALVDGRVDEAETCIMPELVERDPHLRVRLPADPEAKPIRVAGRLQRVAQRPRQLGISVCRDGDEDMRLRCHRRTVAHRRVAPQAGRAIPSIGPTTDAVRAGTAAPSRAPCTDRRSRRTSSRCRRAGASRAPNRASRESSCCRCCGR